MDLINNPSVIGWAIMLGLAALVWALLVCCGSDLAALKKRMRQIEGANCYLTAKGRGGCLAPILACFYGLTWTSLQRASAHDDQA